MNPWLLWLQLSFTKTSPPLKWERWRTEWKVGHRCWLNGRCFFSPSLAHLANTHSTAKKGWTETIDCDYRKEHLTEDLVSLKAYLLAGTTVSVIEEKV